MVARVDKKLEQICSFITVTAESKAQLGEVSDMNLRKASYDTTNLTHRRFFCSDRKT